MGRVAVEILPPLARDEGGTAFRVKDDRILSQDARARIFDVKTASHRGLSELLVGKPFFRFDLQIPRLAPCVSRWNAGLLSSRGARSANGALLSRVRDSVLRARRCGTQSYRPRAGRGRRTARYSRGSWGGGLRRGRRCGARSAGGSLSRLKRGGFREGCRLRRAYEFRGLRGGFLRVFSHGR